MRKEIEKDELLKQLRKSAAKPKAPKLSEDLLYSATRTSEKFGSRSWQTPQLVVNLVGGAAILVGVFALTLNPAQHRTYITPAKELSQDSQMSSSSLIRMGDIQISEDQLIAESSTPLSVFGQKAVGNYVSNFPVAFSNEIWSAKTAPVWVFVVTDKLYMPNAFEPAELAKLLSEEKLLEVADQITSDDSTPGIKLLVQGEDLVLHPLVIPISPGGSYYLELRDYLLPQTFTEVPTN